MRIVLGVTGGIAAYKAATLLRLFTEHGHEVTVVPTDNALNFVGAATWEALSGRPVNTSVFERVDQVNHVRLGHQAELVVVAPATADLLAKAAHGLADDLLTTTLLTATCPVLFAPAMHTQMWEHPATVSNVALLRSRGSQVLDPASGRLTGSDSGPGRLPEAEDIYAAAMNLMDPAPTERPLSGKRLVVTAGGTLEPLDPVRYLGNRSSGKQGLAVAQAALTAGAEVELLAAHVEVSLAEFASHPRATLRRVETAAELQEALGTALDRADAIVMAAAVADFRPAVIAGSKIKKRDDGSSPSLELVRNPDILAELARDRARRGTERPLIIGFAAETGDDQGSVLDYARAKLERKGCDLLVVNPVGHGRVFGQETTEVTILRREGLRGAHSEQGAPQALLGTKTEVAKALTAEIARLLAVTTTG
ncbi:bifunctional phosphopantothenoylcysteine decarboxylase/phosphopantothenate--cysteine ligase CoaBC [Psychromicrobium xiongbiense]|uniref:bifunctional phosphopantothenoylcysteine decarboxylase/phosphopantothenate--cysteine ligase CoaBC n=1 Tax=Psychromicrobium xiongbiense TaxID=3051184 RepID=UPI002552B818|nr:bifunctional phosphopantothenoylcysteine decarboxylase/phosphopantothenate--cysteine ligase CoaBC [Psychromicrobium sp. YIM S02556]